MEKGSSSSVEKRLNTKGCCFLCLTLIADDGTSESSGTRPLVSLKSLQRHFRISNSNKEQKNKKTLSESQDEVVTPSASPCEQDIQVELCNCCRRVVDRFKDAFMSLEKAQMELTYWSERLHCQISEGSKKPEQVQIYSKRMTSDSEILTQLVFVDNLRKEIARKSLSMRLETEARIYLYQSKWKPKRKLLESRVEDTSENQPWRPSEDVRFDNGIDSPEDACKDSVSSDDEEIDTGLPTIATIKHEMDELTGDTSSFTRPSSSVPVLPQSTLERAKIELRRDQMYVKNSKTGLYTCTSCRQQFSKDFSVIKHYKEIHLGKRYPCDKCRRNFTQQRNLQRHKRICNGVKKRREFSRSNNKRYILNPKTGKPSCTACKKEFAFVSGVCRHYDAVHLNKKFKCKLCNMAVFSQQDNLTTHQKTCEATLKKRLSRKLAKEMQIT